MEYNEFCQKVTKEVSRMLGKTYSVRQEKVVKNNQIEYQAIVISKNQVRIAPTIYLESYYNDYKDGKNLTDIGLDIVVHYENCKDELDVDINMLTSYEYMRERVYVRVVNTEMNRELLRSMPHIEYGNLSMTIYGQLDDGTNQHATMNVVNKHLDIWEVSEDELFQQAISNTKTNKPMVLKKMSEVLMDMLKSKLDNCGYEPNEDDEFDDIVEGAKRCIEESKHTEMYVLTNKSGYAGAVNMLFDDIMSNVIEQIDDDVYILPSSIHEIILVPKGSGSSMEELANIVQSVNGSEMDPKEILSNQVYLYERGAGLIWNDDDKH